MTPIQTKEGITEVKTAPGSIACIKCGSPVQPTWNRCPKCAADLQGTSTHVATIENAGTQQWLVPKSSRDQKPNLEARRKGAIKKLVFDILFLILFPSITWWIFVSLMDGLILWIIMNVILVIWSVVDLAKDGIQLGKISREAGGKPINTAVVLAPQEPISILKEKLAKGEISEEEFLRKKALINDA